MQQVKGAGLNLNWVQRVQIGTQQLGLVKIQKLQQSTIVERPPKNKQANKNNP